VRNKDIFLDETPANKIVEKKYQGDAQWLSRSIKKLVSDVVPALMDVQFLL
jgi:hypothetical protein